MSAEFTADCGHVIPATPDGHTGGTGYAVQGTSGFTMCYACCADRMLEDMKLTGKATLYLVSKSPSPVEWHLTDWPGVLDFPAFNMTKSHGYGFGRRYDIVTGLFKGPDGALWSFRNAGDNQIARCKRLKDSR